MKIRNKFYVLKALFLNIALMACSFVTKAMPTATPTMIASTRTPEPTPTIRVTSTPSYSVKAGKTIKIESGGFSVSQIYGYKILNIDNLSAYFTSIDKQIELGMFAYPRPSGSTITGLINDWSEGFGKKYKDINFTDPVEETKNEVESAYVEFTGIDKDVPFHGRLAIYEPPGAKIIYLYIIANGDQRWQREGQKAFETTTKSLKLFKIAALENCPTAKNSEYGSFKTHPIKIGGGQEEGDSRIFDYLGALLGRNGEIVSYGENEPVTYSGVELNVFVLRIGNDYKTIYFDKANYEELLVPVGLSCSAPLPGKPKKGSTL